MKLTFKKAVEHLETWFDFHHGACNDQTTCTMSEAWSQGFTVLAIDGLLGAISIDVKNSHNQEIEALALKSYRWIQRNAKKRWSRRVSLEVKALLKTVSHMDCECGAVIWQPEFCGNWCSSCNTENITQEVS